MKVVIVGHFDDDLDEGVRIVAKNIFSNLKSENINLKKIEINSISGWINIFKFKPDIIHFVITPTTAGLIISKFLSILNPKSKTIISAIHPSIPNFRILKLFKPDLVLTQANESENKFRSLGYRTKIFYNGVDVEKFKDVNKTTKYKLREKYGLSPKKIIFLHLASLKRERNLDIFKNIQKKEETQVLIIGRENEDYDITLKTELEESGCFVWVKHFSNIEEIYNLSDCYIFPTINKKACIETPLSVLEAMACNLPVITTKYGALPGMFQEGDGLIFLEDFNVEGIIKMVKNDLIEIKTREKVLKFSWNVLKLELGEIYRKLKINL